MGPSAARDRDAATEQKILGNSKFAACDYDGAIAIYDGVIEWIWSLPVERRGPLEELLATLLSNRSECNLRTMRFSAALDDAQVSEVWMMHR